MLDWLREILNSRQEDAPASIVIPEHRHARYHLAIPHVSLTM